MIMTQTIDVYFSYPDEIENSVLFKQGIINEQGNLNGWEITETTQGVRYTTVTTNSFYAKELHSAGDREV